jgi:hypothetical protein
VIVAGWWVLARGKPGDEYQNTGVGFVKRVRMVEVANRVATKRQKRQTDSCRLMAKGVTATINAVAEAMRSRKSEGGWRCLVAENR